MLIYPLRNTEPEFCAECGAENRSIALVAIEPRQTGGRRLILCPTCINLLVKTWQSGKIGGE